MANKESPAKREQDVSELLDKLKIGSALPKPNQKFQRELEKTQFKIFECIADLGYFRWTPKGGYKSLSNVTSGSEIQEQIDLKGKPHGLVDTLNLGLPKRFVSSTSSTQEYKNTYPFGQLDTASLHVAFQRRNVEHHDVDFFFGGSTLEMLASRDASSNFLVTKVPGTNVVLIVKRKAYVANYSDIGFQFERLLTGGRFNDKHDLTSVEHLHFMHVGDYRVLFRAEADALYEDEPIEIKVANPAYYGTRVMFQMISNGSPMLCQGTKSRGALVGVHLESLSQVARKALYSGASVKTLETRILDGMTCIQEQMKPHEAGRILKVEFRAGGKLVLSPAPETRANVLLPPDHVVKDLVL